MVRRFTCPEMPFVRQLDIDLFQQICIRGRAPSGSNRFTVYLQTGEDHDAADIAFVFDARFNFGNDRNKIVTNCKNDGAWGQEETRDIAFPFREEEAFKLKIVVGEYSTKVKVNGAYIWTFEHRLDSNTINCVRIDGKVELNEIKLK